MAVLCRAFINITKKILNKTEKEAFNTELHTTSARGERREEKETARVELPSLSESLFEYPKGGEECFFFRFFPPFFLMEV